jgi:hypothetical protein
MSLLTSTPTGFSGVHGDVGGGRADSRLSDITLAWMISKCRSTNLLKFDDEYLISHPPLPKCPPTDPWAIALGATQTTKSAFWKLFDWIQRAIPGLSTTRKPLSKTKTNETIHCSIADRNFGKNRGAQNAVQYKCGALKGTFDVIKGQRQWHTVNAGGIPEVAASELEREHYRGRIRRAENPGIPKLSS